MTTLELFGNGVAAILTLCIFSLLYKDNPFYKFAERLVAGVATGYWTMLLYYTNFQDKVVEPIFQHGQWVYIIPTILGVLMWTRFSKKLAWVSRYPIAIYIGTSAGISITIYMKPYIFKQLEATMIPLSFDMSGLNSLIVAIAVFAALVYFFFSAEHKGVAGSISRLGIYVVMIGFGAGFGLTVMGRIALLVQRVMFLRDYIQALLGMA